MELEQILAGGCYEGQGFGQNFNPSYHQGGLIGHTGIDIGCGYGTPIQALCTGMVYSTYPITPRVTQDGYTAVFQLVTTPLEVFEFSYGHVSEIDCQIGQQVTAGDVIAKEGNYGTVYSGNIRITVDQENSGNHAGSHRHYQKRPVKRVATTTPDKHYLQTADGIYYDGSYYEIYDFTNGFNGCVDWSAPLFTRNLQQGMTGYDIYLLQRALVLEVGFDPANCIGTFGPLTAAALKQYQIKHTLPSTGFCGPMTRAILNSTYQQLQ